MEQNSYEAGYAGEIISLTNKEFELLYKLLSCPGVVFTKQQLMDEVWGYDSETEYDTIKTYISRLRNNMVTDKHVIVRCVSMSIVYGFA